MLETSRFELKPLSDSDPARFEGMTFPAYRHLLSSRPATRHLDADDTKLIQPAGVTAWLDDSPVGLALGECSLERGVPGELLSLYALPELRGQGLGTALVSAFEEELGRSGATAVTAVYMTGGSGIPAVERVLEKRGWSAPTPRMLVLRFTPEQALSTPWFGRVSYRGTDYEIFPWTELTADERAEIKRSHDESPWIAKSLEPWRNENGFDPVSSVGLRYRGRVVGWVINHRTAPDAVRFTCSFMRKDLGRRARILPLFSASVERLHESGCRTCTFITPFSFRTMVEFAKRRCAPWAEFLGETRGSGKVLHG